MIPKTIILQLNELNFSQITNFAKKYNLSNLDKVMSDYSSCNTEKKYELLEPWIQWSSFYTGKYYDEHKIFKIGDTENSNLNFFPDEISNKYSVASFFSMNLPKLSKKSLFFADPWINYKSNNRFINFVQNNLSFFVNNNSNKKISIKYYINLLLIILYFFKFKKLKIYAKLIINSLKLKYFRAILFDFISFEIFNYYFAKYNFDLSLVFINGGAHIQHHHLLEFDQNNDSMIPDDPFSNYLKYLDTFLGDFINKKDCNLLLISGLSQKIIEEPQLYYRLKNHKNFLKMIDIKFVKVQTLMSRDFNIFFENNNELSKALEKLKSLRTSDNKDLFGEFKIYENNKLFLSSVYNSEINDKFLMYKDKKFQLDDILDFSAVKNSVHSDKCYYKFYNQSETKIVLDQFHNITDFYKFFKKLYE